MFEHASNFNAQIGGWDVQKVKNLSCMFQNAFHFNQNLTKWRPTSCTDMTRMFAGTLRKGFDHDISRWPIPPNTRQSNVTYDNYAFQKKFKCATRDHGPIGSCTPKSAAEMTADLALMKLQPIKTEKMATQEARIFAETQEHENRKEQDEETRAKKPPSWFFAT